MCFLSVALHRPNSARRAHLSSAVSSAEGDRFAQQAVLLLFNELEWVESTVRDTKDKPALDGTWQGSAFENEMSTLVQACYLARTRCCSERALGRLGFAMRERCLPGCRRAMMVLRCAALRRHCAACVRNAPMALRTRMGGSTSILDGPKKAWRAQETHRNYSTMMFRDGLRTGWYLNPSAAQQGATNGRRPNRMAFARPRASAPAARPLRALPTRLPTQRDPLPGAVPEPQPLGLR